MRHPKLFPALAAPLTLALLLSLAACKPSAEPEVDRQAETGRRYDVLFILVDTLRADHLGSYGYSRDTSPNLDALAAGGFLFENHTSQASCTFPSVNSMLTSRGPALFFTGAERFMGIPERLLSLPQVLQRHGYRTLAVSASPIVRSTPSNHNPDGGFGGGFETFDEECEWNNASCVNERALDLLRQITEGQITEGQVTERSSDSRVNENAARDPFFLYLHYMEPHGPYRPPEEHELRFARPYEGRDYIAEGDPNPIARMLYNEGETVDYDARDIEHLVDLYDEEIAYFDSQLGALLARLQEQGLLDELLIVIASDHGEEFLEHEHIKHCRSLYQTLIHTPLIVKLPASASRSSALTGGSRIDAVTSNLDVTPTILDYLGLLTEGLPGDPAGDVAFEGASLRPLIEEQRSEEPAAAAAATAAETDAPASFEYAYSVQNVYRSVRNDRFKLIYNLRESTGRLFDLHADPGELQEIQEAQPETYRSMRKELLQWLERQGEDRRRSLEAAEETTARLKALGYLQ